MKQQIQTKLQKTRIDEARKKCATVHSTLESQISTLKNTKGDLNTLYHFFLQWKLVTTTKAWMDQLEV